MGLGSINVAIFAKTSDFHKKISKAQKAFGKFSKGMTKTGKTLTTSVTAPLAALATGAVVAAASFGKSMNKVKAVTGATGAEFDKMSAQAKQLGKTTQFSAGQAAEAMSFLGMAGMSTEEIMSAMPATLDLAAAGGMDLAQAADIASNILSGFGAEASQLGNFTDVLAKGFTSSNTSLGQLGEAMKFVAPVASGMGVSLEESTAAIGKLSDAGIQGGMAGTTLRKILSTLASSAGELGINTMDAAGNMLPLGDIIAQLEKKGHSASKIMEVFGERAGPGMLALIKSGSKGFKELQNNLENSGGTAKDIANTQMEGLAGTMTKLQSALEGVAIDIGQLLIPVIESMAQGVQSLIKWFNGLDKNTKILGIGLAAAAAAAGPLLIFFGAVGSAVATISLPVIGVIAAVAALAAAFVYVMDNIEALKERFSDINWWKNALINMLKFLIKWNPIGQLISAVSGAIEFFGGDPIPNPFEHMADALDNLKVETKDYEHEMGSFADAVVNGMNKAKNAVLGVTQAMGVGSGSGGGGESSETGLIKTKKITLAAKTGQTDSAPQLLKGGQMQMIASQSEMIGQQMSNMSETILQFADTWGMAVQGAFNIINQSIANAQTKLDNYYNSEQKRIDESLMSEEEKAAAMEELDKKVAKKRAELNRKQAISDKMAAVFDATIATASGIAKALPNVVLAGIVGAMGAAQIAGIMSAPIPQFAKGGLVSGPTMGIVGEGIGTSSSNPEVIAPLDKLQGMIGGEIVVTGKVSGNDLLLVQERAQRRQNRIR